MNGAGSSENLLSSPSYDTHALAGRLALVKERIRKACLAYGRDPSSVTLVAVSKSHPAAAIRAALEAGQVVFGENYAQELRDKARDLGVGPVLLGPGAPVAPLPVWHYIGPLQRNKVKYVVGTAALVHGVDSLALGEAISARSGDRPTAVLVQVNVGDESTKSGVSSQIALDLCGQLHALSGLRLRGLMCIPPVSERPEDSAAWFRSLVKLAAAGRARGLPLVELSMGMSHDYEVAIREGATIIRVGTAIFGARSYARASVESGD
jgi:PLP dependent protein